jgi:hypothetical protein
MSANITIAKSVKTERFVHINDVEKKDGDKFLCVCSAELTPVKGEIKEHHFRHPTKYNIAKCRNDALHDYAVQIINDNAEIVIPEQKPIKYSVVGKEVWLEDLYRTDITIKSHSETIHFEIFVTHDLEKKKIEYLEINKIKCVKIDLSNPEFLSASPELIKDEVLNQCDNKQRFGWGEINLGENQKSSTGWLLLLLIGIVAFLGFKSKARPKSRNFKKRHY